MLKSVFDSPLVRSSSAVFVWHGRCVDGNALAAAILCVLYQLTDCTQETAKSNAPPPRCRTLLRTFVSLAQRCPGPVCFPVRVSVCVCVCVCVCVHTQGELTDEGGWSAVETLLLLEALELFGERWDKIAEHVGTKTQVCAQPTFQTTFHLLWCTRCGTLRFCPRADVQHPACGCPACPAWAMSDWASTFCQVPNDPMAGVWRACLDWPVTCGCAPRTHKAPCCLSSVWYVLHVCVSVFTQVQCLLHFLSMPIEDLALDDLERGWSQDGSLSAGGGTSVSGAVREYQPPGTTAVGPYVTRAADGTEIQTGERHMKSLFCRSLDVVSHVSAC